jgi:hypothetical protein
MNAEISPCTALSDAELTTRLDTLAADERHVTVALIASLAEFDRRKLYLPAGYSSLFTYCTSVLHLSEHAAYGRIEAARAARRVPRILDELATGALTLTSVCLLAPLLEEENAAEVLAAARHKSKREVERLVATLRPAAPVAPIIRKLPTRPQPAGASDAPTNPRRSDRPLLASEPIAQASVALLETVQPAIDEALPPRGVDKTRARFPRTVGSDLCFPQSVISTAGQAAASCQSQTPNSSKSTRERS